MNPNSCSRRIRLLGSIRGAVIVAAAVISIAGARAETGTEQFARTGQLPDGAEHFEFSSYEDVAGLFERHRYTPETWQAGIREIPRLYLTEIPPRWRDRVSKEVSVQVKKRLFFRAMAPLVLQANEFLLHDRARVQSARDAWRTGQEPSEDTRSWLQATAARYGVSGDPESPIEIADLSRLLERVDGVPVSLVLSQAAEESGWGTSRFAAEGQALFGQWTWSGEGIKPKEQRAHLGDHRIASFETPLQSIMAYMHNLNTHPAYAGLRAMRAQMRSNDERLSGYRLATTLTSYSERGQDYVDSLHAIMRVNKLDPADDAYLSDGGPIYLIAVGEGAR